MTSKPMEWQAMNGTIGTVRLQQYQKRPSRAVCGLTTAMYGVEANLA